MKAYIATLKEKPEYVRRRIAILTTSTVTGLVALMWVATLPGSAAAPLLQTQEKTREVKIETSSFKNLLGAVGLSGSIDTEASLTTIPEQNTPNKNTTGATSTVIPF